MPIDQSTAIQMGYLAPGPEFLINATTNGNQERPVVAALSGGGFVVTWMSQNQDGSGWGIFAQRYSSEGAALGTEFQVNTHTANSQTMPSITTLETGGFVITWRSDDQDGSASGIYGQQYLADGSTLGEEFRVNTQTANYQVDPSVASLADGGFIVTWSSPLDGSGWGIYGQRFDANGSKVDSEFLVNTQTNNNQELSSVTSLADGGFVVTWISTGQDGSGWGVYAQRFSGTGEKLGSEFRVNTATNGDQYDPAVTATADGGFVVVWMSNGQDGSGQGIFGQRYSSDGTSLGSEFLVNTRTVSDQSHPGIATLSDGGFLVTWMSADQDGSGWGIYAQRYSASGFALGTEFRVNTDPVNDQYYPTVASSTDGGFMITWYDNGRDGSGWGIFGRQFLGGIAQSEERVIGSEGNDLLIGDSSNQTFVGKSGNDTIDGGAGYNVVEYAGSEYDYIIRRQSDGSVTVRALLDTPNEADGTDTLYNIQAVRFLDGAGERVLDDVASVQASTNPTVGFGIETTGQIFRGDQDWYQITGGVANQAIRISFSGNDSSVLTAANASFSNSLWPDQIQSFSLSDSGSLSFSVSNNSLPLNSLSSYRFTLLRDLIGTDGAETLSAGLNAEYLDGKGGNDSLIGSDRSDYLLGGSGNDTLVGGAGNDTLVGGDGANDKDIAVFGGRFGDYTLSPSTWYSTTPAEGVWWRLTNKVSGETDYVKGVEVLRFDDLDYVIDDYDVLTPTDITAQSSYFKLGDTIQGRWTTNYDDDWIAFDFGGTSSDPVVNKDTILRVNVTAFTNLGPHQKSLWFTNATGERLQFSSLSSPSTVISSIDLGGLNTGTQSYLIKASQWGTNGEGGSFVGRRAFIVMDGEWGQERDPSDPYSGAFTVTINRYKEGSAGNDVLTTDGATESARVEELAGLAGNDRLTGTDRSEAFSGGDGNDTIEAGGGDDRLSGGAGADLLRGGNGNDTFTVSGESVVSADTFEGGAGTDTLYVEGTVNLTGSSFSSVERLLGPSTSRVTMTASQLEGFERADGVILTGSNQSFENLAGDYILEGTSGNDLLVGGSGNNIIRPFAGNNTVNGGDGNDIVVWESGLSHPNWDLENRLTSFMSDTYADGDPLALTLRGSYDGGEGNDTLKLRLNGGFYVFFGRWDGNHTEWQYSLDFRGASISNFEAFEISSATYSRSGVEFDYKPSSIIVSTTQLSHFNSLSGGAFVIKGGGLVDLTKVQLLNGATLSLSGDQSYQIIGAASDDFIVTFGGNDTIQAGAGDDQISAGAGVDEITAGDGNDLITISGKTAVTDTIDGGAGVDTLRITGGDVDLSTATLIGIEKLEANSESLALTLAQYEQFAGNLTGTAGLVLKMTDAGLAQVDALPAGFVGIRGTTGADTLRGGTGNDILVGDAGDDELTGGDGNDRLIGGAGTDSLLGGEGNDTLVITGKSLVLDTVEGGGGTDYLVVESGQDLSRAKISSVEVLKGSGTVTVSGSQLREFEVLDGVNAQLAGTQLDLALVNLQLINGARILLSNIDPLLLNTTGNILGGKGNDEIIAGATNDVIYGGSGADLIDAGDGNDTIVGGSGSDTLRGGSGDDLFLVLSDEFSIFAVTHGDNIDGGDGYDTLRVNLGPLYYAGFSMTDQQLVNVESLEIENPYYSTVYLRADQVNDLDRLSFSANLGRLQWFTVNIIGDDQNLDLTAFDPNSTVGTLDLRGSFRDIDATTFVFQAAAGSTDPSILRVWDFDSLRLGGGNDIVDLMGGSGFTVSAGGGDDRIRLENNGVVEGQIDGGSGIDILDLSRTGFFDLRVLRLTNLETVVYGSSAIVVSEEQSKIFDFDGSGRRYVEIAGVINGTDLNDSYAGNGRESFKGGGGDDVIRQVNTAVFSGNFADYDFVQNGRQRTVEHARGTLVDGTDTLEYVANMQFADVTVQIDDAPDVYSFFVGPQGSQGAANYKFLAPIQYGKRVSGKKDNLADVDLFSIVLAPNSPIGIPSSTEQGSWLDFALFDSVTGRQLQFNYHPYGSMPGFWEGPVFQPYQGGNVIAQVRVGDGIQNYAFTFDLRDDFDGAVSTLGEMNPGLGYVKGYIGDIGDSDWVRTELVAGTKYEFRLEGRSSGGGTLADPKLILRDYAGREVEFGLEVNPELIGKDEMIVFRPEASGTYYLDVSDASGLYKGSWTVRQSSLDLVPGNVSSTEIIEWGANRLFRVDGEVNAFSDRDWFKVWFDKGITYTIDAFGQSSGETLSDPQLSLRSVTGILLAQDDNGGWGTDSKVVYTAPESGWYYLDIGASGNASKGTYKLFGATLQDDYASDLSTAGLIELGVPTAGLISFNGDSDWFKVGMTKGLTYVIDLVGDTSPQAQLDPLRDPLLIVRDSGGQILGRYDDAAGSLNSKAFFTPQTTGVFYLEARGAFRYEVGAYEISVNDAPADDFSNVAGTSAAALSFGTPVSGSIGLPGDRDMFRVDLTEGRVYQFQASGLSSNAGSLTDPYIRIFDQNRRLVGYNDNGGVGVDASLFFVPDGSGQYFIEVSASNDREMGTYRVSVVQRDLPPDDVPQGTGTNITLKPGDQFRGTLLTQGDEDWFRISLEQGKDYVFKLLASNSGNGSLRNPYLEIRDSMGRLLVERDDMLISNEPALTLRATTSGDYYIVARASDPSSDTGGYTLITRAPDDYSNARAEATRLYLDSPLSGGIQWSEGVFGARALDSIGIATDFDEDWFTFSATEGQVLSVEVTPVSGSLLSRPMVELIDSNGVTVSIGDGLETLDGKATASFRAKVTGDLFARVIDGAGATGNYSIKLVNGDPSDEDNAAPMPLTFVTSDDITSAQIDARIGLPGDSDQFKVQFQAGHNYRIETLAVRDGSMAPLPGTSMVLSFQATGSTVLSDVPTANPTSSFSTFQTQSYSATQDGTLFITIDASNPRLTGKYSLRVVDLGGAVEDVRPDSVSNYDPITHGSLVAGEIVKGQIDSINDIDLYAITLTAGNIYDFAVRSYIEGLGTLAQGQLRLFDSSGSLVTSGRLDAESGRVDLSVSVFDSGVYYIGVSAQNIEGNTGTFTLDTRLRTTNPDLLDDIASDARSGVIASPGRPAKGRIDYAGDLDWIRAPMHAGKIYVVDVLANGDGAGGTLSDSTLRLLDSNGVELDFDNDSGAGLDSHLYVLANATGDHYLEVGGNGAATGTYTVRVRELYSGVADPLRAAQWHLDALRLGELNGIYSGAGVLVGVIDDGVEYAHPDLMLQIAYADSYDTMYDVPSGIHKWPPPPFLQDMHGTPGAGIIGAQQNNETGVVGVAPDSQIAAIRTGFDWAATIQSMGMMWQFDVVNNSWGSSTPFGDNFNSTAMTFGLEGIRRAVEIGRDGKGSVVVFAAGNSAGDGGSSNYYNFQNAREVIAVGAANADGSPTWFTSPGANVLVGSYGMGVLTTDRLGGLGYNEFGDYTAFGGTSAAAPIVSGVVALMLEANPNLGYRDVQKILAYSASHPDNQVWKTNGAKDWNLGGLRFNDSLGFGLVDAYAAVKLAETWTSQKTAYNEAVVSDRLFGKTMMIPDGTGESLTQTFEIDGDLTIEHVEFGIDLRHARLGDLSIVLTSPSGTSSTLMYRPTVSAERPFGLWGPYSGVPNHLLWDFSSVQFWGEQAQGTWTVSVTDLRAEEVGSIQSFSLRVYGEKSSEDDIYVFTNDGFALSAVSRVLEDETGHDVINAAALTSDILIDFSSRVIASQGVRHTIAEWTVIEDAFSGSGQDRLVGNERSNHLRGLDGNDTLIGGFGNDTLDGGAGTDTVIYSGNMAEYSRSWDPNLRQMTVIDNLHSNGNDGQDTLVGIERIIFADGEISLGSTVGNRTPIANSTLFGEPIIVGKGSGINFTLPKSAFTDPDGSSEDLQIEVTLAGGGEIPEWLSYDEKTGKFSGVPPEDYQAQLQIRVTATDEYGESTSDILTLQFGDNQAPVLDLPSEKILQEDQGLVPLNVSIPFDPEGKDVRVTVTEIPTKGYVVDKNGIRLFVGAELTADELSEVHYQTTPDDFGSAGYFRYKAIDEDDVSSESSVQFFVNPVNDAPRFATQSGKLIINYPAQATVELDMLQPNDPESILTNVQVIGLPELGVAALDGNALQLNQILTFDQLKRLTFTLSENVNGPIGALTIQAVDPQGLATNWSLELEVQGDASFNTGTSGADALYGSTGNDTLYGLAGDDTIVGNAGADRLLGGLGNDSLFGGSGNDVLDGSSGNDYLDGGLGNDTMSGGPGNDTFIVDTASDVVIEAISGGAGGIDLIVTSVTLTAPTNVENLQAAAAPLAAINLFGNQLDNVLVGNEDDNLLSGAGGRDTLFGGIGNDTLDGGVGVDRLVGGTGDDTYVVDSRFDVIIELPNEGIDTVRASSSYTLSSNLENLILEEGGDYSAGGNSLNNHLIGNSGNNVLAGGLGRDTLEGLR